MKQKIMNIVIYSMLGWSFLSAGYLALPEQYQAMIPQMNWLMALVGGGSTAVLGTTGLALKSFLSNTQTNIKQEYNDLATKFLDLTDKYKALENSYIELKNEIKTSYNELTVATKQNSELLKVELQTKLANPLIDKTSKELIEGVLNVKKI